MDYEKGKKIEDVLYQISDIVPNWDERKEIKSAEELEKIYTKIERCESILKDVLGR